MDQPIVWYEGTGTTDRRFLSSDERGSIVSLTDGTGALLTINSYDEYGIPGTANAGRFQYTGQAWLPELGIQYSKARIYSPTLGRFLQTDPIGVAGGINLYGYVGNDPVNSIDPLGLKWVYSCVGIDGGGLDCGWHYDEDPTLRTIDLVGIGGALFNRNDPIPSQTEGGEESIPCVPTKQQLSNSGPVKFAGVAGSAYFALGWGMTRGRFTTESGLSGDFTATAFGFGLGPSFSAVGGVDDSLANFMGGSDNVNVGAFGLEASFSKNVNGGSWQLNSGAIGTDFGFENALAGALKTTSPLLALNASVTFTVTEISNVTCPVE